MGSNVYDSLKWMNERGIWSLAQTVVLAGSAVVGAKLLFFPKTRVRHLNFSTRIRAGDGDFPLRLDLEIRNLTGHTAVVSNAWFEFNKLRPDPRSQGDTPSGEFEVRFPGPNSLALTEVEYLVRTKESLSTYIPLDPKHTLGEAEAALASHNVGRITCTVTWLLERPKSHQLRRRL
jgi:hypothetical protein